MSLPGAIVQGAGSIISGILGSSAAKKAAQQQVLAGQKVIDTTGQTVGTGQAQVATGTGQANDVLSRSAETQLGMYAPYTSAGTTALPQLEDLAGPNGQLTQQFSFNPSNLAEDPGYKFTLEQGQQAIQRAAAAQGGLFSTGTLKSLAGYTTGSANQYFNDAYNRAANTFNINRQGALSRIGTLQGLAGLGYSGTAAGAGAVGNTSAQQAQNSYNEGTTQAQLGMQGNQIIANALQGQGNSQAAGTVGSANAWGNAIGGTANAIGSYLTTRNLQNLGSPKYANGGQYTLGYPSGG